MMTKMICLKVKCKKFKIVMFTRKYKMGSKTSFKIELLKS